MLVELPTQDRDRNTTQPDIAVDHIEKSASIASIVQHHLQFHSVIPREPLKMSLNYIIAQIYQSRSQMPGKLWQTNKSWRSYGCAIAWKNYLDRQVDRKRKEKIWHDVHTLLWELSQELQWYLLRPRPIIRFSENKNWPKTHEKLTEVDKTFLSSLGMKQSFKRKHFIVRYIINFLYEIKHVGLPLLVNLG